MPSELQEHTFSGEETMTVKTVTTSAAGEIIHNQLITPRVVQRLGVLSSAFQRIKWHECKVRVVPLNGSTVTAGYTAGIVEDPEFPIPKSGSKDVIPFLTTLRATVVRQAWVEDKAGMQVPVGDRPRMYTQAGTDIRRQSPGRFVMAAGGVINNGTFQVMLKYKVTVSVPCAIIPITDVETNMLAGLTANSEVSFFNVNMPQTNFNNVAFSESIELVDDMLVTTRATNTTTGGAPGSSIIALRRGTFGEFTSVNVNGSLQLTFKTRGQPEGEVYYVLRWTSPGEGQSWILNTVPVPGSANPSPFTAWVTP